MKFIKKFLNRLETDDYLYSVEIYKSVIDRIKNNISVSSIEEGGKLIGNIIEKDNQIIIKIFSFLDSGPNVDNSRTHIIPDGEHQEFLFRIIEGYDSNIEHIGSWHSHHCNNYNDLSSGDIQGYYTDVNSPNFNLNWFFVMLVLGFKDTDLLSKFYLFNRGNKKYFQIPLNNINIVDKTYKFENILSEVEATSLSNRKLYRAKEPSYHNSEKIFQPNDDTSILPKIRLEDKVWLKKKFPSAKVLLNKTDNSIKWKWSIPLLDGSMHVNYLYPNDNINSKKAELSVSYLQYEFPKIEIDLNDNRFDKIIFHIDKIKASIEMNSRNNNKS